MLSVIEGATLLFAQEEGAKFFVFAEAEHPVTGARIVLRLPGRAEVIAGEDLARLDAQIARAAASPS